MKRYSATHQFSPHVVQLWHRRGDGQPQPCIPQNFLQRICIGIHHWLMRVIFHSFNVWFKNECTERAWGIEKMRGNILLQIVCHYWSSLIKHTDTFFCRKRLTIEEKMPLVITPEPILVHTGRLSPENSWIKIRLPEHERNILVTLCKVSRSVALISLYRRDEKGRHLNSIYSFIRKQRSQRRVHICRNGKNAKDPLLITNFRNLASPSNLLNGHIYWHYNKSEID